MVEMRGLEMYRENLHPNQSNILKSLSLTQQSPFDLDYQFVP